MEKMQIIDVPPKIFSEMLEKKIWQPLCPVAKERLKIVRIPYYDFAGKINEGEMMVFDVLAAAVIKIFKRLYEMNFPLKQMQLINAFNGDDDASMAANNSSCFNFRFIAGTNRISIHGYAMAIDINPVQNPFIINSQNDSNGETLILPPEGSAYLDRTQKKPGMVEDIVPIFKQNGFKIWGGDWQHPKDYHHFQVDSEIAAQLVNCDFETGKKIWADYQNK